MFVTRKSGRLGVILLLAALAFLHVRIAFADCPRAENAASEPTQSCCQSAAASVGESQRDASGVALQCGYHRARIPAPQKPAGNLLLPISGASSGPFYRHPVVYHSGLPGLDLRRFLANPPVTHQLIYLLQRLLI